MPNEFERFYFWLEGYTDAGAFDKDVILAKMKQVMSDEKTPLPEPKPVLDVGITPDEYEKTCENVESLPEEDEDLPKVGETINIKYEWNETTREDKKTLGDEAEKGQHEIIKKVSKNEVEKYLKKEDKHEGSIILI